MINRIEQENHCENIYKITIHYNIVDTIVLELAYKRDLAYNSDN